jgi:hypothetical protein
MRSIIMGWRQSPRNFASTVAYEQWLLRSQSRMTRAGSRTAPRVALGSARVATMQATLPHPNPDRRLNPPQPNPDQDWRGLPRRP